MMKLIEEESRTAAKSPAAHAPDETDALEADALNWEKYHVPPGTPIPDHLRGMKVRGGIEALWALQSCKPRKMLDENGVEVDVDQRYLVPTPFRRHPRKPTPPELVPRYTLREMLAQCDFNAPPTEDVASWDTTSAPIDGGHHATSV